MMIRGVPAAKTSRRRRPWCGCITGKDDPPEVIRKLSLIIILLNISLHQITYCIADSAGGGLSLQAVTPTQPMPEEEEVDMTIITIGIDHHIIISSS